MCRAFGGGSGAGNCEGGIKLPLHNVYPGTIFVIGVYLYCSQGLTTAHVEIANISTGILGIASTTTRNST